MSAKCEPISLLDARVPGNYQDICIINSILSIREREKIKYGFPCSASCMHKLLWKDKTEYLICLKWGRAELPDQGGFNRTQESQAVK